MQPSQVGVAGCAGTLLGGPPPFLPEAYESHCLLWKQASHRPLSPDDRATLHGMPPSITAPLGRTVADPQARRAARNSLIGGGSHLPSYVMALLVMFQLVESRPAYALLTSAFAYSPDEAWLRSRVDGTCLQPGFCETLPCCLSWSRLAGDMAILLEIESPHPAVMNFVAALSDVPASTIQLFVCHRFLAGDVELEFGPDWLAQRRRASCVAALGRQRAGR